MIERVFNLLAVDCVSAAYSMPASIDLSYILIIENHPPFISDNQNAADIWAFLSPALSASLLPYLPHLLLSSTNPDLRYCPVTVLMCPEGVFLLFRWLLKNDQFSLQFLQ